MRLTITPLPMGTPSELLREARTFYDLAEKGVETAEDALQGASDIIAK